MDYRKLLPEGTYGDVELTLIDFFLDRGRSREDAEMLASTGMETAAWALEERLKYDPDGSSHWVSQENKATRDVMAAKIMYTLVELGVDFGDAAQWANKFVEHLQYGLTLKAKRYDGGGYER